MARSKYVTGGVIASIIWLIVVGIPVIFRNSADARYENIAARSGCRGADNFSGCMDAYYAAIGGGAEINWARIVLVLVGGLVVIWGIVFLLKSMRGGKAEE